MGRVGAFQTAYNKVLYKFICLLTFLKYEILLSEAHRMDENSNQSYIKYNEQKNS